MPANRASNIKRRIIQADDAVERAIQHLADVYITVDPQHPDIGAALLTHMLYLDNTRRAYLQLYCTWWAGDTRQLWHEGDLKRIIEHAQIVPDPKARGAR